MDGPLPLDRDVTFQFVIFYYISTVTEKNTIRDQSRCKCLSANVLCNIKTVNYSLHFCLYNKWLCLTCIIRQRQLFFRSKIPLLLDIELTFVSRWGFINSSRIPTRKIDGSGILEDLQSDFQSKKQTALPFYIRICCLKLWNRASNQRVQFAQECY